MPAIKYDTIYRSLRQAVETEEYPCGGMLPSEHQLVQRFGCSRNTVRRAIARLVEEGYVQTSHGKGVLVIYRKGGQEPASPAGLESLRETAAREGLALRTRVVRFEERTVDSGLSARTGFPAGSKIYYIQRVRYLDGAALLMDHSYFLKSVVRGLTIDIAEDSVYAYMEGVLGETIVTSQRRYTVEPETPLDTQYLDMGEYHCLVVVNSKTFNKDGVMFEYTDSRRRPDRFVLYEMAKRRRAE